jgi:antitoxin HicB
MIERTKILVSDGSPFDPAGYAVSLRPLHDSEGGGWLAVMPELPGCTGDGESEMEAIEDVRLAAWEWAAAAMADGDPVPAPSSRNSLAAE